VQILEKCPQKYLPFYRKSTTYIAKSRILSISTRTP
jgi:hypothetical protein